MTHFTLCRSPPIWQARAVDGWPACVIAEYHDLMSETGGVSWPDTTQLLIGFEGLPVDQRSPPANGRGFAPVLSPASHEASTVSGTLATLIGY